jgi:hypothetical protein
MSPGAHTVGVTRCERALPVFLDGRPTNVGKLSSSEAIIMKKLFVLSAIAVLAACGGSDNKPAGDPSTTSTTADPSKTGTDPSKTPAAPTTGAAPASTDATKPADAPKK